MKPQKGSAKAEVEEEFDFTRKIIIIGDSGVGKSSLLVRYTKGKFAENYMMTIGISHFWKVILVDDLRLKLNIWDTAGQEKYKTITRNYYRNTHGAVIAFSVNSRESFFSVSTPYLIQELGSMILLQKPSKTSLSFLLAPRRT